MSGTCSIEYGNDLWRYGAAGRWSMLCMEVNLASEEEQILGFLFLLQK